MADRFMLASRTRAICVLAMSYFAVIALFAAASVRAQSQPFDAPISIGAGQTNVGVDVSTERQSPIRGRVVLYPPRLPLSAKPPVKAVVFDKPDGCVVIAATGQQGYHVLFNQTNAPLTVYADAGCQIPAPSYLGATGAIVPSNYGAHIDLASSFRVKSPVDLTQAIGNLNIGAYVVGTEPPSAPIVFMPTPDGPLLSDTAPGPCKPLTNTLHTVFNGGRGTLYLWTDPLCTVKADTIPPGYIQHVFASVSTAYSYDDAPPQTSATRTRVACRRASLARSQRSRSLGKRSATCKRTRKAKARTPAHSRR